MREALDEHGLGAPQDVRLGNKTLDEMRLDVFGLAVESKYAADFGLQ